MTDGLRELLANALRGSSRRGVPAVRPFVAVDENLNDRVLWDALSRLHLGGYLAGYRAAWVEYRTGADGAAVTVSGPPGTPGRHVFDIGKPVKGSSFPDTEVAKKLARLLALTGLVVFLTGNRRRDSSGIRMILERAFEPEIRQFASDQFGLHCLLRRSKAELADYVEAVVKYLSNGDLAPGYHFVVLPP